MSSVILRSLISVYRSQLARYDNRDECEIAESLIDPAWQWEVDFQEVIDSS